MLLLAAHMLLLFAGCNDDDNGDSKETLASIVAETVNYSTTTNCITTQGSRGVTYAAVIADQGEEAWCSFALNEQVTEMRGEAGDPVYLYMDQNRTGEDRTARIDLNFSDGYAASFTMTQRSSGSTITYDYERSWGEQPFYLENSDFIYKTYYTTLTTTEYVAGG